MAHDTLIIHPDRFEDMAMAITNNLLLRKLIADDDYDIVTESIMRTLKGQLYTNKTWTVEDEGSIKRFRSDRPDGVDGDAG